MAWTEKHERQAAAMRERHARELPLMRQLWRRGYPNSGPRGVILKRLRERRYRDKWKKEAAQLGREIERALRA